MGPEAARRSDQNLGGFPARQAAAHVGWHVCHALTISNLCISIVRTLCVPQNMHPRLGDLDPSGFNYTKNAVTIRGTVVINGTAAVPPSGEFEPGAEAVRTVLGAIAM